MFSNRLEFLSECEKAAEEFVVEIIDIYAEPDAGDNVVEDDGILHVTRFGQRVAFDVSDNQTWSKHRQNTVTKNILRFLDIPVTQEALV